MATGTIDWQPKHQRPAPETKIQGTEVNKPEADARTVIDLRVSEIVSAFVVALGQLNLVTQRINKLCDKTNHELDKQSN